jgi:YaiO family outer membrane protein
MRPLLAILLALAACPTAAQTAWTEAEIGATHESLTGGNRDWDSVYLDAVRNFGERRALAGGLRNVERFGLRDSEARLGYYHPLGATWTGHVEGSASDEHHVLPKYSVFGQVSGAFSGGLGVNAGLRRNEYTRATVHVLALGLERYWGNWRGAYTLYSGHPEGAGSASAHRFQLHYYYGTRSSIGLSGTRGREVENAGPPAGVLTSDVRSIALSGRHWMTPQWGLTWELLVHEQGDLYRRRGVLLGLRHRF